MYQELENQPFFSILYIARVSVYDITSLSKNSFSSDIYTLIIHHYDEKDIISFFLKFKNSRANKIIIKDYPISQKEREKIYKMFGDIILECKILENQKQEIPIENESKKEDEAKITKGLTKDSEINEVIDKIKVVIAPMNDKIEQKISQELENLILQYLQEQEQLTNLLTEIEDYRSLQEKAIDIPSQIETRSDKALYSIAVSTLFQNSQIM